MSKERNIISIEDAVQKLNQGIPIGMPTETVYGLAARIDKPDGIQKIFTFKKRPFFDPLIVHVFSIDQAKTLVEGWGRVHQSLASSFWPGPLTMVLQKKSLVSDLITSGLNTVGVRMPNHPMALKLIESVGCPLAAPSANRFGRTSPTTAADVLVELGDQGVSCIDGGPSQVGIESTIIEASEDQSQAVITVLRPGGISNDQIRTSLKGCGISKVDFTKPNLNSVKASGQLKHHYMPQIPLVLVSPDHSEADVIKFYLEHHEEIPSEFEGVKLNRPTKVSNLSELILPAAPELAARELYSNLRRCSSNNADIIFCRVNDQFQTDSWVAIRDRLFKAASLIHPKVKI